MIQSLLFILGVNLLMYARSVNYDYQIDDFDVSRRPIIAKNKLQFLWQHLIGIKYTNIKFAHLLTMAIHIIVCMLVYLVFGRNNISFLTALLFSINPVNNQVSLWLSGRTFGMATLLILLSMLYLPLMPILYPLGLCMTLGILVAPLLFIIKQPHWGVLLLILGIIVAKRKQYDSVRIRLNWTSDTMIKFNWRKIIVFFKTLGYYFILCLLPIRLGMFHEYLHNFGRSTEESEPCYKIDRYFFVGVSLCGWLFYKLFFGLTPFDFGLFWFVLFTIQWCNVIMLNHAISERYIYLANIGLMYSLSQLLLETPLMWIFLTFYAVRLFYFMPAYKNRITFWTSNTENFPSVAMAYNQLGIEQATFGNGGSALDSFIKGVQERPNDFRLNYNIANILIGNGQFPLAVQFLKKAGENINKKCDFEFWNSKMEEMRNILRGAKLWQ